MGREIRRVPPHWEHPRYTADDAPYRNRAGEYKPLYEGDYETAKVEWIAGLLAWEAGERPEWASADTREWWDHESDPPKRGDYVPYRKEDATWLQMYETVSEGTPLSPPFPDAASLVEWLCTHKDFWGYGPRTRDVAERFVTGGWAPSFIVSNDPVHGVHMGDGIEMLARIAQGEA